MWLIYIYIYIVILLEGHGNLQAIWGYGASEQKVGLDGVDTPQTVMNTKENICDCIQNITTQNINWERKKNFDPMWVRVAAPRLDLGPFLLLNLAPVFHKNDDKKQTKYYDVTEY